MKSNKVSIVIPTKNGGPLFALLLAKLRRQKYAGSFEIIVVDSGSSDETLKAAKQFATKIIPIAPLKFTHSFARNKGAQAAAGNILLFVVQDALPSDDNWLQKFTDAFLALNRRKVVAASCTEYPRSDADLFACYLIHGHNKYLNCLKNDRIMRFRSNDHRVLMKDCRLSNVACLIYKNIFNQYKFGGSYAEDLDLGLRLIRDGHKLCLMSSVKIIHSHTRPPYYFLKREFVDLVTMSGLFPGYARSTWPDVPLYFSSLRLFQATITLCCGKLLQAGSFCKKNEAIKIFLNHALNNANGMPAQKIYASANKINSGIADPAIVTFLDSFTATKAKLGNFSRFMIDDFSILSSGFLDHITGIYPVLRGTLLQEAVDGLQKIAASVSGRHLARLYLTCKKQNIASGVMDKINGTLRANI